ncbi:MAG: OB-fold protein [Bacteroidota bacterium]
MYSKYFFRYSLNFLAILLLFSCTKEFCEESKLTKDRIAEEELFKLQNSDSLPLTLLNYQRILELEYWASTSKDTFDLFDMGKMRFIEIDSLNVNCALIIRGTERIESSKYINKQIDFGEITSYIPLITFKSSGEIERFYTLLESKEGNQKLLQNDDFDINDLVNNRKLQSLINTKERRISQRERENRQSAQAYQKQLKINKAKREREEKQAKIEEERAEKRELEKRIENAEYASSLLEYFYKNEVRANDQFKDRKFDIKGTVYRILDDDTDGIARIVLESDVYGSIICYVEESIALSQLGTGDFVVIEGQCVGLFEEKSNLYFMESKIVAY